jgi:hypothetical protein
MSIAIYYQARRANAITLPEKEAIAELRVKYAIEKQLQKYLEFGEGFNWESFAVYDRTPGDVIFEGATKLPDNSGDAVWHGVQHWCNLLTEIRKALPHASWSVTVEDHPIPWDEQLQRYEPSL